MGDFDSYGADPRRVEKAGESFSGVKVNYDAKYKKSLEIVKNNYETFEVPYYGNDNNDYVNGLGFCCNPSGETSASSATGKMTTKNDNAELQQFYYHPDHLGSSSYISNLDGEVVQHIEYVPFGEVFLEEKNSKWNTPYLFTSKELDRETGMYYFGARYYEPKLSLWASVDPLAEKYPGVSSYAYCLNGPVNYVDPDGKEVFFIHGTTSNSKRWNTGIVRAIMKITNSKLYNTSFNWKAPINNNVKDRAQAAKELAKYVLANHKKGDEITLAGHSHGGNVAIQAADIIYKMTGEKVNIVTIATPAYNKSNDVENPKNHSGINDHIAFWNEIDGVSGGLAGEDFYTNSNKTKNIEVNVNQYYRKYERIKDRWGKTTINEVNDKMGAHSFDVEHPESIEKSIKQNNVKLNPVK